MSSEVLYDEMDIVRYDAKTGLQKIDDAVVREASIRIFVNTKEIVALRSLKDQVEELALGFLYTECIINDISKVREIQINDGLHAVTVLTDEFIPYGKVPTVRSITSGCGAGVTFINPMTSDLFLVNELCSTLEAHRIPKLMQNLTRVSDLFVRTGAVHTAALSDGEELIHVADDIGRHNCIDKLVGWSLRNRESTPKRIVYLSSGRLSSDIVAKSIRGRAEYVISHSAPTRGAVQLARAFGITLIGFARGNRYNIYSNRERIVI